MKRWIENYKKELKQANNVDMTLDLITEIERLEEDNKRLIKERLAVSGVNYDYLLNLEAIAEKVEAIDWEGVIFIVDEYPNVIMELRALQQAIAAYDKATKEEK